MAKDKGKLLDIYKRLDKEGAGVKVVPSEALMAILDSIGDLEAKVDAIPAKVDVGPVLQGVEECMDGTLEEILTAIDNIPHPKFPDIKIPAFPRVPNYEHRLASIQTALETLVSEIKNLKLMVALVEPGVSQEELQKTVKDLKDAFPRRGGSIYTAWQSDRSADGTLSGTVNGSNTVFVLRKRAQNGILFMFRNGVLDPTTDFTLGTDQRTITYSGFPPQSGDSMEAKYPT